MLGLIDGHCHLQWLPRTVISESLSQGVSHFICNSTSPADWEEVLSMQSPNLTPCIGIHPWYVNSINSDWEGLMQDLVSRPGVHIGEIGLDNCRKKIAPKALQELFFRKQLEIAKKAQKVVSVHCVAAFGEIEKILNEEKGIRVLMHSWEGPLDLTRRLIGEFGNNILFSLSMASVSKEKHRDMVERVPIENVMIETDSPSLCVEEMIREDVERRDGKPLNKPIYLKYVLERLALIRNCSEASLSPQISANFSRLFHDNYL